MKKLERLIPNAVLIFSICGACTPANTVGPGDLDTTEAGLATGAVLGAGLGALVGSTAGEAGAGLVVGSVAGATSGGMIGRAIEGQERRLDIHDSEAGVNSDRIVDTERGRLGDKIWVPAGKFQSENESNRPSGERGQAAAYYRQHADSEVDLPRSSIQRATVHQIHQQPLARQNAIPEQDLLTPSTTTSLFQAAKTAPVLPGSVSRPNEIISSGTIRSNSLPAEVPIRTPTTEMPPAKAKEMYSEFNGSRGKLSDTSTSRIITANGTQSKINTSSQVAGKSLPPAATTSLRPAATSGAANTGVTNTAKQTTPNRIPPASTTSVACAAGQAEYKRAHDSVSDSDKVFYLRRTILSCPKQSALRVELGKVYARLGLKEDARKEFTQALEIEPSNETAQDELSIMMLDAE